MPLKDIFGSKRPEQPWEKITPANFVRPFVHEMTRFEKALKTKFDAFHGDGVHNSLLVILKPNPDKKGAYGTIFFPVKDGVDPWKCIRYAESQGCHVAMGFDLASPDTLETQFVEWLPGTIHYPSHFIAKPAYTIAPDTTSPIGLPAVRHKENGMHMTAPSFIRGVVTGGLSTPAPAP